MCVCVCSVYSEALSLLDNIRSSIGAAVQCKESAFPANAELFTFSVSAHEFIWVVVILILSSYAATLPRLSGLGQHCWLSGSVPGALCFKFACTLVFSGKTGGPEILKCHELLSQACDMAGAVSSLCPFCAPGGLMTLVSLNR